MLKTLTFQNEQDLASYIAEHHPTFYFGSQTSTVVPYEKLEALLGPKTSLGNLSQLKPVLSLDQDENLVVRGSATWKDAMSFCLSEGREVMTSPTEELALVTSGVATSCTGERCFGHGTLREQIVSLEYIDFEGRTQRLSGDKPLIKHSAFNSEEGKEFLKLYQKSYKPFANFKNAPFPRLENETDLLTGTEGQLGIITEVVLKTRPRKEVKYIFLYLPPWEENLDGHLELFKKVQNLRDKVYSCELIDHNSLSDLPQEQRPRDNQDLIFLEVDNAHFDEVYEQLLSRLDCVSEENIFEMTPSKCKELRVAVPRATFEINSKMGVTKKGTDVQVSPENFEKLLNLYKSWKDLGIKYNLFGHFGDAHLHFNFMPLPKDEKLCNSKLEDLYQSVESWKGSPFAEHGIGIIKREFITSFWTNIQSKTFRYLKETLDPKNQFFPEGFMSLCVEE